MYIAHGRYATNFICHVQCISIYTCSTNTQQYQFSYSSSLHVKIFERFWCSRFWWKRTHRAAAKQRERKNGHLHHGAYIGGVRPELLSLVQIVKNALRFCTSYSTQKVYSTKLFTFRISNFKPTLWRFILNWKIVIVLPFENVSNNHSFSAFSCLLCLSWNYLLFSGDLVYLFPFLVSPSFCEALIHICKIIMPILPGWWQFWVWITLFIWYHNMPSPVKAHTF